MVYSSNGTTVVEFVSGFSESNLYWIMRTKDRTD